MSININIDSNLYDTRDIEKFEKSLLRNKMSDNHKWFLYYNNVISVHKKLINTIHRDELTVDEIITLQQETIDNLKSKHDLKTLEQEKLILRKEELQKKEKEENDK